MVVLYRLQNDFWYMICESLVVVAILLIFLLCSFVLLFRVYWVYYAPGYCKWENHLRTSGFALGKLVELFPLQKCFSAHHVWELSWQHYFIWTLEVVNGNSGIHTLSCSIYLGKVFGIWISNVLNWHTKQLEWRHNEGLL